MNEEVSPTLKVPPVPTLSHRHTLNVPPAQSQALRQQVLMMQRGNSIDITKLQQVNLIA